MFDIRRAFFGLFKFLLTEIIRTSWGRWKSVADPVFPRGGGANPPGASTYDFVKISQKLHEIERIWAPRPP